MPTAGPLTAAITGLGISRIARMIGWYRSVKTMYTSGRPFGVVLPPLTSLRSAPEEKPRPAPVTITARTASSSPTPRTAASRSIPNCDVPRVQRVRSVQFDRADAIADADVDRLKLDVRLAHGSPLVVPSPGLAGRARRVPPAARPLAGRRPPLARLQPRPPLARLQPRAPPSTPSVGGDPMVWRVKRPVIGICTALELASWSVWQQPAALLPVNYIEAVQRAGGIVLMLAPDPRLTEDPEQALDLLDGLILAGGADIDAATYGRQAHPETRQHRARARRFRGRARARRDRARPAAARHLPGDAAPQRRPRRHARPARPRPGRSRGAQARRRLLRRAPTTTSS